MDAPRAKWIVSSTWPSASSTVASAQAPPFSLSHASSVSAELDAVTAFCSCVISLSEAPSGVTLQSKRVYYRRRVVHSTVKYSSVCHLVFGYDMLFVFFVVWYAYG